MVSSELFSYSLFFELVRSSSFTASTITSYSKKTVNSKRILLLLFFTELSSRVTENLSQNWTSQQWNFHAGSPRNQTGKQSVGWMTIREWRTDLNCEADCWTVVPAHSPSSSYPWRRPWEPSCRLHHPSIRSQLRIHKFTFIFFFYIISNFKHQFPETSIFHYSHEMSRTQHLSNNLFSPVS